MIVFVSALKGKGAKLYFDEDSQKECDTAPEALYNSQKHCIACKMQSHHQGVLKWPNRAGEQSILRLLGSLINFGSKVFFILAALLWEAKTPEEKKGGNNVNDGNSGINLAAFLARACGGPLSRRSGGRLATTLVATKNDIIFFSFFPVVYFSHRRSARIKKLI